MAQHGKLSDIDTMTVGALKEEIRRTTTNLDDGIKAGHAIELLAAALHIQYLGDELRASLERWLQLDLWNAESGERDLE